MDFLGKNIEMFKMAYMMMSQHWFNKSLPEPVMTKIYDVI